MAMDVPFNLQFKRAKPLGSGYDLNQLGTSGIFDVNNPTNGPSTGRYFIMVVANSEESPEFRIGMQIAWDFDDGTEWYRINNTGTWTDWAERGSSGSEPFDLAFFYSGKPTSSAVVLQFTALRAVTFAASLTGSDGDAAVAATAQTDFNVLKNGVSVGTIRFAAAGTTATFISAGFSLAAGDILKVTAPASADATLSDIGVTLTGTLA
jgi:hypothetical protein